MLERQRAVLSFVHQTPARRVAALAAARARRLVVAAFPDVAAARWPVADLLMPPWPVPQRSHALPGSPSLEIADGVLRLRSSGGEVGAETGWTALAGADRLTTFEVHGWQWVRLLFLHRSEHLASGEATESFSSFWRTWEAAHPFPRGDAWHPFVVAVRMWALFDVFDSLVRGGYAEANVRQHLALSAGYLQRNLERHLEGNHLLKDLKALVGAAFASGSPSSVSDAAECFLNEADNQVLPDGGHIERSPSYHMQVLVDMLDVRDLLIASGYQSDRLDQLIFRAQRWAAALRLPDGSLPPFNDSSRVPAGLLDSVGIDPPRDPEVPTLANLSSSGFVVLRTSRICLIAETGGPDRRYPGHAHAGTLGFELWRDGAPVIVDTGASTYEGARREYERSTRAHNTIVVDGVNSSAVWGGFRSSLLARSSVVSSGAAAFAAEASLGGTRRNIRHRRLWQFRGDDVIVEDEILGRGLHDIQVALHLAAGIEPIREDRGIFRAGAARITISGPSGMEVELQPKSSCTAVSDGIGCLKDAAIIVGSLRTQLPCRLRTTIT